MTSNWSGTAPTQREGTSAEITHARQGKGMLMSPTTRTVIWGLFGAWAVALVVFLVKFHNFVDHPIGHSNGGGGGIFLVISQAALAAAMLLIWRRPKTSRVSR